MKNLSKTYILALSIIALVITASQYLVQRSIATNSYDSRTINISGRQSMLSQRISKAALALEKAENEDEFLYRKNELQDAADLWERSHNALQYGSDEMQLDDVNNSEQTFLYFLDLEPHYISIKEAIQNISDFDYEDKGSRAFRSSIDKIMSSEDDYLRLMTNITFDYDNESAERLNKLAITEYILYGIALFLLFIEAMLIFRPAIKRINDYTQKLIKQEESIKKALQETQKEKAKVEYLNNQAETVFTNVDQGIFLMDERYNISDLHSNALEEIFEKKDLSGTNFISLLRPRLVQRDQEALEMFVKHLFNMKIEEDVLEDLNPVEQVQIFSDNQGEASIQSRYIRIRFSRIRDKEKIYSILVTVTDETAEVLMKKEIEETQERNKREAEQLLSILKVEPLVLKEFLDNTKATLNNISLKYENDKSQDFRELINFTFNTIHNLKGNALLIDLQLLADKFHDIETTITELKDKQEIVGNNFLKILYEISEVTSIVNNMQRMFVRIAEVNKTVSEDGRVSSNQLFVNSLEKGLRRMNDETGKDVKLEFDDNGVPIPERFKLSVKDISIQLIRNSLAHGIETADERKKVGKTASSTISFNVNEDKDNLYLTYQDDGRGLDFDRIGNKALENRIVTEEELSTMSDDDKALLIFSDGFSTAKVVDQYSGRGQGMSLIKQIVEKYNGKFAVSTKKGKQFKINITLPLETQPQLTEAL